MQNSGQLPKIKRRMHTPALCAAVTTPRIESARITQKGLMLSVGDR